jgi:cobalt/nickel transport system permease protein
MYLTLSPFTEGNSFIHRCDPRVKVMITLLFIVILASTQQLIVLNIGSGLALIMVWLARLPLLPLLQRMLVINLFNLLLFLVLPISIPGLSLFQVGNLSVSAAGVQQAIVISIKTNAMLLWLTALLSTIETITLAHVLQRFYLPDKLILLLLFTLRYVEVLYQEYLRLRQAMRIRAFVPRANRHTYRSFAYLIGMLLVKSLDRSERVMSAMKCRGFQGKILVFQQFDWKIADLGFALTMLGCGLGLIGMIWMLPP